MPFESLSERLQMSLRRITGRGRVNENDINEMMKEVRVSLLEADVNYRVVKSFINDVKEKALGERVMKSLTPGDQVVKVVHEELKKLQSKKINTEKNAIMIAELYDYIKLDIRGGEKYGKMGRKCYISTIFCCY